MRKAMIVSLLFLVPIVIGATLLAVESRRPPDWQRQVNQYTAYMEQVSAERMTVQEACPAQRPWEFRSEISAAAYGDSPHYQTDYGYTGKNVGAKPLPFPPQEIWCVLLGSEQGQAAASTEEGAYRVVFVALHQDLYNADWVLHEGTGGVFSEELMGILSKIGCDLELEQAARHREDLWGL